MHLIFILGILFAIRVAEGHVVRQVTIDRSALNDGENFPDGFKNQFKANDGRVFQGDYLMLGNSREIKFVQNPIPQNTRQPKKKNQLTVNGTQSPATAVLLNFKAVRTPYASFAVGLQRPTTRRSLKVYNAMRDIAKLIVVRTVPRCKIVRAEVAMDHIRRRNAASLMSKNVLAIVSNSPTTLNVERHVKRKVVKTVGQVKRVMNETQSSNHTAKTEDVKET